MKAHDSSGVGSTWALRLRVQPKWLVPVIRENLPVGRSVRYGAAIIATWVRYAEGSDEAGAPIDVVDRLRDQVMAAGAETRKDPLAFLQQRDLFLDLADQPAFVGPTSKPSKYCTAP